MPGAAASAVNFLWPRYIALYTSEPISWLLVGSCTDSYSQLSFGLVLLQAFKASIPYLAMQWHLWV